MESDTLLFAKRLKAAMTDAGYELRPVVLEREFNTRYWGRSVTVQAVRRWLHGEAIPSQDKVQVLAEWLKVEPHILRFGAGPVLRVASQQMRWDAGIGYAEREMFEAYLTLSAAEKKTIRDVVMAFARARAAAPADAKG